MPERIIPLHSGWDRCPLPVRYNFQFILGWEPPIWSHWICYFIQGVANASFGSSHFKSHSKGGNGPAHTIPFRAGDRFV